MINQLHVPFAILFIKLTGIHENLRVFEPNKIKLERVQFYLCLYHKCILVLYETLDERSRIEVRRIYAPKA